MVRRAQKQEHNRTRTLWEEVFQEDTKEFLDYYYKEVAAKNRIYLDEENGDIVSMLHCNPYHVWMGKREADVSFIFSVATRPSCRHQGRMRKLLNTALYEAAQRKEPFVFLTPVSEKIYRPFGFCMVGYQDVRSFGTPSGVKDVSWKCIPAKKEQLEEVAVFSQTTLKRYCRVYSARNRNYFSHIWTEQQAVNGGILLLYKNDVLRGYCFTGREDGTEVWELVVAKEKDVSGQSADKTQAGQTWQRDYACALQAVTEYLRDDMPVKVSGLLPGAQIEGSSRKETAFRPLTMVRIADLESFAERLTAACESEMFLKIRDDFLPQNSGCFRLKVSPAGGRITRLNPGDCDYERAVAGTEFSIETWTETVFGIRQAEGLYLPGLEILHPVYFNELV